mmetsp:Transcript_97247/g.216991  ORF Transcript_97247/g.216991 Transcript_97247/m.216991 type:complete len:217 (-) Transcript_97247:641-1291(-)
MLPRALTSPALRSAHRSLALCPGALRRRGLAERPVIVPPETRPKEVAEGLAILLPPLAEGRHLGGKASSEHCLPCGARGHPQRERRVRVDEARARDPRHAAAARKLRAATPYAVWRGDELPASHYLRALAHLHCHAIPGDLHAHGAAVAVDDPKAGASWVRVLKHLPRSVVDIEVWRQGRQETRVVVPTDPAVLRHRVDLGAGIGHKHLLGREVVE